MALELWELEQRHRGNIAAAEVAQVLRKQYGDVPLPGGVRDQTLQQAPLALVIAEFRAGRLNTPDAVTRGWQTRWIVWGEKVGLNIIVPDFPGTQESLNEALRRGDKPIYVPPELSTQDKRHLLGRIWPQMQSHAVGEGNTVTNEANHTGWRYTESAIDAPNSNTTEGQLRKIFEGMGRAGLTVTEYIIASQDAKALEGRYFDGGPTWSLLLGSLLEGGVVYAYFHSNGYLSVEWNLHPEPPDPVIGGRSSLGATKA